MRDAFRQRRPLTPKWSTAAAAESYLNPAAHAPPLRLVRPPESSRCIRGVVNRERDHPRRVADDVVPSVRRSRTGAIAAPWQRSAAVRGRRRRPRARGDVSTQSVRRRSTFVRDGRRASHARASDSRGAHEHVPSDSSRGTLLGSSWMDAELAEYRDVSADGEAAKHTGDDGTLPPSSPFVTMVFVTLQREPPLTRIFAPGLRAPSRSTTRRVGSPRRRKMAAARPAAPAPTIATSHEEGRFSPGASMRYVRRQPRRSGSGGGCRGGSRARREDLRVRTARVRG